MPYTLVWRRDGSPGIVWYIRCLGPEGFYGEVRWQSAERGTCGRANGVNHRLSIADGERVASILTELSAPGCTAPGLCFALLGQWAETLGQGEIVFKYELGAEANCPQARRFLELHAVIEPYLAEAYAQIAVPGDAADEEA